MFVNLNNDQHRDLHEQLHYLRLILQDCVYIGTSVVSALPKELSQIQRSYRTFRDDPVRYDAYTAGTGPGYGAADDAGVVYSAVCGWG